MYQQGHSFLEQTCASRAAEAWLKRLTWTTGRTPNDLDEWTEAAEHTTTRRATEAWLMCTDMDSRTNPSSPGR
jgi:hypothetical protein